MNYSIIIPIYNEKIYIPTLLDKLIPYAENNQEIIIVDDGSTDGSSTILRDSDFIKLVENKINSGKGHAIRVGIQLASNDKIILFDGDMELDPKEISSLMILDYHKRNALGLRYERIDPLKSMWDLANYFFTNLFNTIYGTRITDVLCCAKAFYKSDINASSLKSNGFDIDLELLKIIISNNHEINPVMLSYNRRRKIDGKKLNIFDSWSLLKQLRNS